MRNVFTVFRKEMRRYFTDPRMLLALFLPGVLIFALYSAMGKLFTSSLMETKVENTVYRVAYTDNYGPDAAPKINLNLQSYIDNEPKERTNDVEYYPINSDSVENAKNDVIAGKYEVLIEFSKDFEVTTVDDPSLLLTRYIRVYYNGATPAGSRLYGIVASLVDVSYKGYVYNIDAKGQAINPNLAAKDFQSTKVLSIVVPLLTMSLLFSSVVSVCPDAVAGEKERGTLSAMLLTPIKRGELAFGKILALSVVAIASGLVAFLGLIGGLPSMLQGVDFGFTPLMVTLLGLLIVTTLILFVSLGTLVSTFSKTSKECSSYMIPLMVLSTVSAILPLAIDATQITWAFVPILNIAVSMNVLIGTGVINPLFFGITIGVNAALVVLAIFVTSRLFTSERVMVK